MMFYIVVCISFLGDILSKGYAIGHYQKNVSLIGDFLFLQTMTNKGIAFSLPLEGLLLKVITIFLIIGIYAYYLSYEEKNAYTVFAYALILGGALGNGYERVLYSGVTDFIGVKYFSVFNIADICICIGVFILLIYGYGKGRLTTSRNNT